MTEKKKKKAGIKNAKKILKIIDENKRSVAEKLFEKAAFMERTLDELQEQIKADGAVIRTTNGNGFEVLSEHPAQKSYNAMIGRYNALMKAIVDMIPDGKAEDDELMKFLGGNGK